LCATYSGGEVGGTSNSCNPMSASESVLRIELPDHDDSVVKDTELSDSELSEFSDEGGGESATSGSLFFFLF
jgi:hypothetical protein